MRQIIDFGKSIPSSFSQSATLPVQSLPNSTILGQFGLNVGTNGSVLLEGTIGLQNSMANSSDVIFTVVRNAVEIFSLRSSGRDAGDFETVHFSFADSGIAAGYYGYALTVSAIGAMNQPVVVGPLLFSGMSIL
ncbi:hypothetical protein PAECIP111892_00175 [Paenibacillus auburnensis]|uniref:Exosporium leader peptide n=1 Tax=Paenibacillus auburnensis TaxID=2905649 RepID=A0ABM9BM75_9BACL|nr:hypothetical protein [Paenibacillus auburnensis]CAH1190425.1 hypothetical protein PAECIP111892_00175 [Paenibacillus auburnensis]